MMRRRPTSPAALHISSVASNIRSGRSEFLSRARIDTKTVCAKLG